MSSTSSKPLLSVRDLTIQFGGVKALDGVSFDVYPGETVGLIGPNGAGKTSLFNCLSRHYHPTSGTITYDGISLLEQPTHAGAKLGIGRTFQELALFQNMTVLENILTGMHARGKSPLLRSMLQPAWLDRDENELRRKAYDLITMFYLDLYAQKPVKGLPYGVAKRVELARALAFRPRLLLLDEPAAGLAPAEIRELADIMRRLKSTPGDARIIVEHNISFVMETCDRIVVLDLGKKIADGPPERVRKDPEVVRAYLGLEA